MAGADFVSPAELYEEYAAQEQTYFDAAAEYRKRLLEMLSAAKFDVAVVEARHKKPLELFKKQRRKKYADPWKECPDLVGARVVVPIESDKKKLVDVVTQSGVFSSVHVEDQSESAKADQIVYLGLHVHLGSELVDSLGHPISCELQIRTTAEHSWAMTEHKYVYKKSASLPYEIQRTFRRLLVLVELYDLELSRGVEMVKLLPDYAEMKLVLHLESLYEQETGRAGDQETTREMVSLIAHSTHLSADEMGKIVDDYLASSRNNLGELLKDHGPESPEFDVEMAWITSQPEVVLVLALLDFDQYRLSSALSGTDAFSLIEPIALWTDSLGFLDS